MRKTGFLYGLSLTLAATSFAQHCSVPGQTPVSATYVCTSETFHISTPEFCGQTTVPTPCADGNIYRNTNPSFFRFNCYNAGTLGLSILPNDLSANYDWQLFDITSTNPIDIFTNPNLFIACNWSSDPGETGASLDGLNLMVCTGSAQTLFSKMPNLLVGHAYLLMVCNQSASAAGYQLTFAGGTAVITDPVDPHLLSADLSCDRTKINLRLMKQVRCNTLASDGSDFSVTGGVNIIAALPGDCTTPFGTSTITLTLNQPLGFGTFNLTIGNGSDANTLIDICGRSIPVGESISFVSSAVVSTPMDSVFTITCSPSFIELVFKKPILCHSIAADGSDFIITGPVAISGIPFIPGCAMNSTTSIIRLNLSANIVAGSYQVQLVTGSDGNTILNECGAATPPGSTVAFMAADAVEAAFSRSNPSSCNDNTVSFLHNGANNVNSWTWDFGNGIKSLLPNPTVTFAPGQYNVTLTVSNGVCTNSWTEIVRISKEFEAAFDAPNTICPGDSLHLVNKSNGIIDSWQWDFGNGIRSNDQTPVGHKYTSNGRETFYTIRLIAANTLLNCRDTAYRVVKALTNCLITVPSAFTPNGDGKNDHLYPLNALNADQLEFKVYNRLGQLIFFTRDWTKKWDGRIHGVEQSTGVYAWLLNFIDRDTGKKNFQKGTTLLIR